MCSLPYIASLVLAICFFMLKGTKNRSNIWKTGKYGFPRDLISTRTPKIHDFSILKAESNHVVPEPCLSQTSQQMTAGKHLKLLSCCLDSVSTQSGAA